RLIIEQSKMVQESSQSDVKSVNILSEQSKSESGKFSIYGQNAVAKANRDGLLVEFAKNLPNPKERKKLLADGVKAKNSDIWIRYVFREAFGINGKDLSPEWIKFSEQLKNNSKPSITKKTQLSQYIELLASCPLDDKKIKEGFEILLWLLSDGYIVQKTYISGI